MSSCTDQYSPCAKRRTCDDAQSEPVVSICPYCGGVGIVYTGRNYCNGLPINEPCEDCKGTGVLLADRPSRPV